MLKYEIILNEEIQKLWIQGYKPRYIRASKRFYKKLKTELGIITSMYIFAPVYNIIQYTSPLGVFTIVEDDNLSGESFILSEDMLVKVVKLLPKRR